MMTVDHHLPKAKHPELEFDYSNLLLACFECNINKGVNLFPDPCKLGYAELVLLHEDGLYEGLSANGRGMIRRFGLNGKSYLNFRRHWIRLLGEVLTIELPPKDQAQAEAELVAFLGFPDDLPDLSSHKPEGNTLPDGISSSWYSRRQFGDLPDVY